LNAITTVFGGDEHWHQFLFSHKKPELRLTPEELLAESLGFSHGERILIQVALDLWSEQGKARLTDLLEVLDEDAFLRVIAALLQFRELTLEDLHPHFDSPDEN
jgi:hypothetical protein